VPRGCTFSTVLGCSAAELGEVVALAEAGKIQMRTERFPLEKVAEAYSRLQANQVQGRAVIMPNG
jgi:propanol-preferring alcohol dehydrogenase